MHSAKQHQLKLSLGCLPLVILVILGFMLLFFGGIYLKIKFISVIFTVATRELGIDFKLGVFLFIVSIVGCWIHIPLYSVRPSQRGQLKFYGSCPVWTLEQTDKVYREQFQPETYIALNLVGGAIPIMIALYQFSRNSSTSILVMTAIVAIMSYLFATVIPGRGICFRWHQLWILVIITAFFALKMAQGSSDSAAAIAFSGSVLGTLVGADLLHLREAQAKAFGRVLSIGGAGMKDGIVRSGLIALLLAEWIPYGIDFFKTQIWP